MPIRVKAAFGEVQEIPRFTSRRDLIVRGVGLGLLSGSSGVCRAESPTTKEGHEFFDPDELPWHPAPGHGPGVWERIVSGGRDVGVTTRGCLNFEVRYRATR